MQNSSYYLPGFHLATLRKKPRSAREKLADEHARMRHHSLSRLGDSLGALIPTHELHADSSGSFSRRRVFSKENTFWAFFSQVLDADGGCQEGSIKGQTTVYRQILSI